MGIKSFEKIRIKLASPEKIYEWSHGEVTKPETINYRTLNPEMDGLFCERIFGPSKDWECACGKYKRMRYKGLVVTKPETINYRTLNPEMDGLFCERIFGPSKDWECACGKYKRMRYKGLVCEKCGVEVTKSKVRRERMGHIALAAPVSHIWYSKGTPNKMALVLGISPKELESVLYFARYIVIESNEETLPVGKILNEKEYKLFKQMYGNSFDAKMGAEAILRLLDDLDLPVLREELEKELEDVNSSQKRKKVAKRLKIVRDFMESNNKPSWMILKNDPVIPAD